MTAYADKIARRTPLPPTWELKVQMTDELMEMIVAFGSACAREGYALGHAAGSCR